MSGSRAIGVGVIGCGEIAQLMHLPFLAELPETSIAAVCDLSPGTVDAVAERFGVKARYTSAADLVADPGVEAVVVCTYDHTQVALAVLNAGKHVLIEKPLAFTPDQGAELVAAARAAGVVASIGYMKLYDPAFELARQLIHDAGPARVRQMHNLAGRFDTYRSLYTQSRVPDVPQQTIDAERSAVTALTGRLLGPDHAGWTQLYLTLLMLGSHDLAVMRSTFGTPSRVSYAAAPSDSQLLAVLDYPAGTRYRWWDEWLAVATDEVQVRINFSHPYIRYLPSSVAVRETRYDSPADTVLRVSSDEPFRRELLQFVGAIRGMQPTRTPIEDGLRDLELAIALIRALPPKPEATGGGQ